MKNKQIIILTLTVLLLASLACSLFTGGDGDTAEPEKSSDQDAPVTESSEPQYEPGYEPGWRIFSNANYVNGVDFYEGILWAATEGGVVAWDVKNDHYTKYTPLDGVGHLSTYDVVVCPMPEPTVVVATERGLSLYNLATKKWDTTPITPEDSRVATNVIDSLFCDKQNGRLLIGYRGVGILDISSGNFQQYTEENGLAWTGVDGVAVSGSEIWVGGYKGVSVIKGGNIQIYNESTGMVDESARAIVSTPDGAVWAATSAGLIQFQNGNVNLFSRDTTENFPGSLAALAVAQDGTIWAASNYSDICQFDPASKKCTYTYTGNTDYYLIDITTGDSGDAYYATYGGGIWAYNGSEWRNLFIKEDQLVGNFVEAFAEDSNGMMWVATNQGVQRFDPNSIDSAWETFKGGEGGPASNWGQGVFISPSGKVWFANDSGYVSMFDGSTWSRFGSKEGVPGSVSAIAFDKDDTAYIGTSEGILVMKDGAQSVLTDADGLPSKNIRSLLFDGDTLWIGTTDGLARLQNGSIETVLDSNSNGMPDDNISVIRKADDGSLLLGTSNGLVRYADGQVTTVLQPKSVSSLFGDTPQAISDVAIAPDGSLWVGTYSGVYHGDGQDWEQFSTVNGLPAININAVFVNSSGVVWVGGGYTRSGGGIARFIPGETTSNNTSDQDTGPVEEAGGSESPIGEVKYDENTGMPLYPDAEQVYSTDSGLNYWSNTDFATLREFYLTEMPNIGWPLDVDENGKCLDDDRCMGWHRDYNDPENQTFNFLKGEKGYVTLNLIPENGKVNVIFMINEPE